MKWVLCILLFSQMAFAGRVFVDFENSKEFLLVERPVLMGNIQFKICETTNPSQCRPVQSQGKTLREEGYSLAELEEARNQIEREERVYGGASDLVRVALPGVLLLKLATDVKDLWRVAPQIGIRHAKWRALSMVVSGLILVPFLNGLSRDLTEKTYYLNSEGQEEIANLLNEDTASPDYTVIIKGVGLEQLEFGLVHALARVE